MRCCRAIVLAVGLVCGIAVDARAQLKTVAYASGFASPIAMVQDPTDRTVQFVVEQGGRIRVIRNGTVLPTDFLDLAGSISLGGERGLLGLAFAPDYVDEPPLLRQLHQPGGQHRGRAVPRGRPIR